MFRRLIKNRKAQNTAEYAILISLVVAGIVAMQTYAQRALQARVHDASGYMTTQTADLGTLTQYEPYYLSSDYIVTKNDTETELLDNTQTRMEVSSNRLRDAGGFQQSTYDPATFD
ncbi:MAG: hypothetical protein KC618_00075 [Candidatus Omnitrophica bacterium]|nr:hypothetical protein [Candidatus Omnitrophota bacterium]